MRLSQSLILGFFLSFVGPPNPLFAGPPEEGILIMGHGREESWNRAFLETTALVKAQCPVQIALGVTWALSLERAVKSLEARGVKRIAVVRVFMSPNSFLETTRKILGLDPGAPPRPKNTAELESSTPRPDSYLHSPNPMALWRIASNADFGLNESGLIGAKETAEIVTSLVREMSRNPEMESVLLVSHGSHEGPEDVLWIKGMEKMAQSVKKAEDFHTVRIATLRENLPKARAEAEGHIRKIVEDNSRNGLRTLIVPIRLFDPGPFKSFLQGLRYEFSGRTLLPDARVARWIESEARGIFRKKGWTNSCFAD